MSLFDAARYRLRALFRPDDAARDRDDELGFHQSLSADQIAQETGDADEARYRARRELGNPTYMKETMRHMGALRWVDGFLQDLRFAARSFGRAPVFAGVAVLSIALGIGANTSIFGVINALLLERLAVRRPAELVQLERADSTGRHDWPFTPAEFEAIHNSGASVVSWTPASVASAEIAGQGYNRIAVEVVDGEYFQMLGVRAGAGRLISPADDANGAPVVVLGNAAAVRYYGSASAAVGQTMRLQNLTFSVIGVLPREFRGLMLDNPMGIVVPRRAAAFLRPDSFLMMVARLPLDAGAAKRAAIETVFRGCCAAGQLATGDFVRPGSHVGFRDISRGIPGGKMDVRATFARVLYALMGGVAIILLIACTNVGNLLLARATVRTRELAVRLSLGASRARLMRQMLAESALLAVTGAALGVGLAMWGTAALSSRLPGMLRVLQPYVAIRPNLPILAFTAVVAIGCTILFGVLPALRATRIDPINGLRASPSAGRRSSRLDRAIVAVQVSLALVLVASAGLLGATLRNLETGAGAEDPTRLLVVQIDTRGTPYESAPKLPIYDEVEKRLRTLPGVRSIAATDVVPLIYGGFAASVVSVAGMEDRSQEESSSGLISTAPGFFHTTGVLLTKGRDFSAADVPGAPKVAIVNETFVRDMLNGRDPIGEMIGFGEGARDIQVVGVVADVKQTSLRSAAQRIMYRPIAQLRENAPAGFFTDRGVWAVRTDIAAADVSPAARRVINEVAPGIFIRNVDPMTSLIAFQLSREKALAFLSLLFGAIALGLAAIGLYGVMAFQVTARTREIGVRMALGAGRGEVVAMVLRQSLVLVAIGVVVGVPLALGAGRSLASLLYGVAPFEAGPIVMAVLALVGVGVIASVIPSRTAARVDPLVAMRAD